MKTEAQISLTTGHDTAVRSRRDPSPPRRRAGAMQRLQKQLLPALRAAFPLPASHFSSRLLSASTATLSPTRFVDEDALVAACGLTGAEALKASKRLQKVPSNLDAALTFLAFLADFRLSKDDIAAASSRYPRFLHLKVDETLTSQVARLRDIGLSTPEIGRLITIAPCILSNPRTISRLEFYLSFLGSYPRVHSALRNNSSLLRRNNIESEVKPNIAFLEQCGLTTCDIAKILMSGSRILIMQPEHVKEIVACADKFGMPRESAGFRYALMAVTGISPVRVSAKLDFLRMVIGCSDAQLHIAVSRFPLILTYSEVKLSRSLEFLKAEVGLEPQYIVLRPALLSHSIQKRLMPRYHVMKVLNEKGLLKKDTDFYSMVKIVEESFFKKFLLPYHRSVPGLEKAYLAAREGKMFPEI